MELNSSKYGLEVCLKTVVVGRRGILNSVSILKVNPILNISSSDILFKVPKSLDSTPTD